MSEEEQKELMAKADKFDKTKDLSLAMREDYKLPVAPDGKDIKAEVEQLLEESKDPDKREKKRVKNRVKNIWSRYRSNVLGKFDLQNYKDYCQIEIETAETESKLREIQQQREKQEAQHWLDMNKGNLAEIGYNTESKPSKFWYGLNRGLWYFKKTCSNIPKTTWYVLCGILGIGVIVLMALGLAKIV